MMPSIPLFTEDFKDIMVVPKAWGSETWLCNTVLYCSKLLEVRRGWQCSLHKHLKKDETFTILSGMIFLEWEDDNFSRRFRRMVRGDSQHIRPGTLHRFTGMLDSVILETSTFHSDHDVVRIEESKQKCGPLMHF